MNGTQEQESRNPFIADGGYSPESVELMRALSSYRKTAGNSTSTPEQIFGVIVSLGYRREGHQAMSQADAARLFAVAMSKFQKQNDVPYPTCQDVLNVIDQLGYYRPVEDTPTLIPGLPIDRRRREADNRNDRGERRSSLELSPQEQMELTEQEHLFLDALKELRNQTGREFSSSEELLSIAWDLGYRPENEDGYVQQWLDDDDRCRAQIAFTTRVEQRMIASNDGEFLTCRSLLEIVQEIGFRQHN